MKQFLEQLIKRSLDDLYQNDKYLIDHKVAETDITHRFAHYFENNMQGTDVAQYNVDCEYNRDGHESKRLDGSLIYPDFILHKRGHNDDNLLVIEFKTCWNTDTGEDIKKIEKMMSPNGRFKYRYGYSIIINENAAQITKITV